MGEVLTFEEVEGRIVDAFALQLRTEGGKGPFARDAPWHLIRKKDQDEFFGGNKSPSRMPRLPLSGAEMVALEEVQGWLRLIEGDEERLIVVMAAGAMARRGGRPPWSAIVKAMRLDVTRQCVAGRYGRAVTALCLRINRGR
jgi:hypothetical protein